MKTIATIQVDLDTAPLGTRSRLADELRGVPILRRTVQRVSRVAQVEAVYVLCPADQRQRCEALLQGLQAVVQPFDAPPASWTALVQAARKWSIDGWRGGLGGTSYFDEFVDTRLIDGLNRDVQADAILTIPAAAVLFDPDLADRMIQHHAKREDDSQMTFTQAPPGLAGIVLDAQTAHELTQANIPIGWVFSYKPDNPQKDLIFQPSCLDIPVDARYAVGRVLADTDRGVQRIERLLGDHDDPDVEQVGRWLRQVESTWVDPWPYEVEIELTTDDPYPNALLRPRGTRVQPRGPIDPELVGRIVSELTRFDDSLVLLGGFGEPLRHPRFEAVLEAIRSAGGDRSLYGLAVRTSAVDLTDEKIEALLSHDVDVLEVLLDAWTPELYSQLQTPGSPDQAQLGAVLERLDRLAELRPSDRTVRPIVVPHMTKSRHNVHEQDEFHDGWLRQLGAVAIAGYSHRGGQCEDHSVMSMAPPSRLACERIRSRCVILADGGVTLCDEDFNGRHTVGCVADSSFEEIWQGAEFNRVRDAHAAGKFDPTPLCLACDEWHRP